jgi:hypothetical protein
MDQLRHLEHPLRLDKATSTFVHTLYFNSTLLAPTRNAGPATHRLGTATVCNRPKGTPKRSVHQSCFSNFPATVRGCSLGNSQKKTIRFACLLTLHLCAYSLLCESTNTKSGPMLDTRRGGSGSKVSKSTTCLPITLKEAAGLPVGGDVLYFISCLHLLSHSRVRLDISPPLAEGTITASTDSSVALALDY